ncbi:GntR family transcriptional regulator [Notoacmeibacter marinus]|uniref:GntR family transcriptional regulator n=1 Tax=Notoacmeibacter marinus TaxID=1876515 RepID=A0A231V0Q1_9HYPH|nr:GntR family transcriptional regulator [Notoacmeibacter marinus]OXT01710.1 GntR family transcriptional regulator [Notoacmeibacter marinus]
MQAGRLSWKDVREAIHEWILSGRYGPGDKLPRDADIAVELACARSTVQRAMQDLSDSGIVERRRKGGTRVRQDPVVRATLDIPITRREIEDRGGLYDYRLIERSFGKPPRAVRIAMNLSDAPDMLRIEALHLCDGRPYIFEDRWVCTTTAPNILKVDLSRDSANEWLVRNAPYTRFEVKFFALNADQRTAELMATTPRSALLAIERTTWLDDRPITHVTAIAAPGYRLLSRS